MQHASYWAGMGASPDSSSGQGTIYGGAEGYGSAHRWLVTASL